MEAASGPRFGGADGGAPLAAELGRCGADLAYECYVWHVAKLPAGEVSAPVYEISTLGSQGREKIHGRALVIATGARERFYPRPGWTLPGVFGLGAATVMLQSRVLPGSHVVVVGPGTMAQSVATQIKDCGGEVVAHVDPSSRRRWVEAASRLAQRVGFPARRRAGSAGAAARDAPRYHGWDVAAINGASAVESVTLQRVDEKWRPLARHKARTISADALCIGYGLAPAAEVYQLLGARLRYAPTLGGWTPVVDRSQRTDVSRLYGAGDSAGVLGAPAAYNTGRMAALSAAFDLGRLDRASYEREMRAAHRVQARAARAASALADLTRPRSSAMAWVPDATIACRCESITAGELRRAIGEGAREINALKAATRCGMGPCGGRTCEEGAAALLECARYSRERIGKLTARAPLRPLPLTALTGTFAYSDIPFPQAADT